MRCDSTPVTLRLLLPCPVTPPLLSLLLCYSHAALLHPPLADCLLDLVQDLAGIKELGLCLVPAAKHLVHVPQLGGRQAHLCLRCRPADLGVDPEAQLAKLTLRLRREEVLNELIRRLPHTGAAALNHLVHHRDGALNAHVLCGDDVGQRLVPVHLVGQDHLVLVRQQHVTNPLFVEHIGRLARISGLHHHVVKHLPHVRLRRRVPLLDLTAPQC
mmetsp:Transcript_19651/g.42660  ORF Transcript_19651/g.42660 Transcript_19651/m.42660 type:complete len:215 (-) Transcript_19651:838-1482(-)